jgi:hypothetical protein
LRQNKAAVATFSDMLSLVRKHRQSIVFELDFVEELVRAGLALKACHEYLEMAEFPAEGDWRARSSKLLKRISSKIRKDRR